MSVNLGSEFVMIFSLDNDDHVINEIDIFSVNTSLMHIH